MEDLTVVRELNNKELIELEQQRHALCLENQHFQAKISSLMEEKEKLLDYVDEQ